MITPIPPAYTIPKSNHQIPRKEIPGPGYYNLSQLSLPNTQSYSFSKSPRKIHNIYSIPGPGVYNPNNTTRSSGYSLSKSPRFADLRTGSPGPGDYDLKILQKKYQWSISKAKSRYSNYSESPGPGYYSPNLSVSKENSPKLKFPRQDRMPRDTFLTPSPGQYALPEVRRAPGFTIPKAFPKPKISYSPGPGVYEIPSTIGVASLRSKS